MNVSQSNSTDLSKIEPMQEAVVPVNKTKRGRPKRTSVQPKKLSDSVVETDEVTEKADKVVTVAAKRGRPGRKSSKDLNKDGNTDAKKMDTKLVSDKTIDADKNKDNKTDKAKDTKVKEETVDNTSDKTIATPVREPGKEVTKGTDNETVKTENQDIKTEQPQASAAQKINASEVAKIQGGRGRRSKASLASALMASIKGVTPPPMVDKNRTTQSFEF